MLFLYFTLFSVMKMNSNAVISVSLCHSFSFIGDDYQSITLSYMFIEFVYINSSSKLFLIS